MMTSRVRCTDGEVHIKVEEIRLLFLFPHSSFHIDSVPHLYKMAYRTRNSSTMLGLAAFIVLVSYPLLCCEEANG
jgi:hypothetical protein